ncbi:MAG: hypothetical protein PHT07_10755 [Paludibacter sp.]|nr:hypothetical protein [Paludibacter sp.]
MKRFFLFLSASFILAGCVDPQPKLQKDGFRQDSLSLLLERVGHKEQKKYALSSKDILLRSDETSNLNTFEDVEKFLETKGLVIEVVANKFRTDLPKIVECHEKGKYAGTITTVQYSPLPDKPLKDVMLDLGMTIHYTVLMDQDVLAESNYLSPPSRGFNGKTASDFLNYVSLAYDYHVNIDVASATISLKKYQSEVIGVLADKDKIRKDSEIFLPADSKKVKQFVADTGKMFITGTPEAIDKAKKYAEEINRFNANRVVLSFDGKEGLSSVLSQLGHSKQLTITISDGDFIPDRDTGKWFDTVNEVDEYIRKYYSKKLVEIEKKDTDLDGKEDRFVYAVKEVKGVPLTIPTTVNGFFKSLGNIQGVEYIVDGDANIPVTRTVIDDFEHLRNYLWASAGIKITMTDAGPGLPKIIKVDGR